MKFEAGIHGIDLEKEIGKDTNVKRDVKKPGKKAETKESKFLFGDPKDYDKQPLEERQRLTDQMMMYYRGKMSKAIGGQ